MLVGIFLTIFLFFLYLYSAGNDSPYDYFTRLARAYLSGNYYLTEAPPWLNELIPTGQCKYFVPYPPMPAILLLPFLKIFPTSFTQNHLSYLVGAGIGFLTFLSSLKIKRDLGLAVWSLFCVGMGSIVWFMASTASSWYVGQLVAAFFLTAAINESLGKKRPVVMGIFLGAAYLSRVHVVLSFPYFLFVLYTSLDKSYFLKRLVRAFSQFALGLLPFLLFNFYYNFIRFGVIWDRGYYLIPGVLDEVWFHKGLIHPSYIANNLKTMFLSFPIFQNTKPYVLPSWAGLSILITTPPFILLTKIKKTKENLAALAALLPVALVVFLHGTTGFAQFGYRFAVDFYPFLFLLLIRVVAKSQKGPAWFLLVLAILVNFWGVLWINKFGWVRY